jgi:hypothetical protein
MGSDHTYFTASVVDLAEARAEVSHACVLFDRPRWTLTSFALQMPLYTATPSDTPDGSTAGRSCRTSREVAGADQSRS